VDELTDLARSAAGGDRGALAALVRDTQADVWHLCRHLAGSAAADDLAQEVYVRALGALPSFRGDRGLRPWLLAIARHTAIDHVRREQRQRRLTDRLRSSAADGAPHSTDHTDALLALLDLDRRVAFVLTQLVGLSYAEAAAVAGVPVGTIRSRVARARAELLDHLRQTERS
jgi:RNA polymerase sigma-70 factor (ECF subfamily)